MLDQWLRLHRPALEALDLKASITLGPSDRDKTAALLDIESSKGSSRLRLWSSGEAELVIFDFMTKEVVLEEHREISTHLGLDEVLENVKVWLT